MAMVKVLKILQIKVYLRIPWEIKSFLPKIRAEFAKYFINWSSSDIAKKLLDIATNNKYYDK